MNPSGSIDRNIDEIVMPTVRKVIHRPHSKAVESLYKDIADLLKLLHLSHEAIICIDEDQNIVVFNDGAEKIFGFKHKDIIGAPLERLIPGQFHADHSEHVKGFLHGNKKAKLMAKRAPTSSTTTAGSHLLCTRQGATARTTAPQGAA